MVLSKKRARHVIEEIIALFPDAKPSLDFRNHFELLVAVMLSAQTTDAAVNKATPGLFAAFPTPQAMAAASEADIAKHISKLGLYRNKAKFLKKCAQQLLDNFDGTAMQLFGNWIKWWFFTIITFGIYVFWLNIKVTQWITKHTHFID